MKNNHLNQFSPLSILIELPILQCNSFKWVLIALVPTPCLAVTRRLQCASSFDNNTNHTNFNKSQTINPLRLEAQPLSCKACCVPQQCEHTVCPFSHQSCKPRQASPGSDTGPSAHTTAQRGLQLWWLHRHIAEKYRWPLHKRGWAWDHKTRQLDLRPPLLLQLGPHASKETSRTLMHNCEYLFVQIEVLHSTL